jgi:2-polyprenyl-3-methyl-5-hydroxy-6-metoxy-1,4-benzoquinol methylase
VNPIRSENDLDTLRRQSAAYAVLLSWVRHGLIDQLSGGDPIPADELGAHPDAIRNTAPVLAHLGVLIRHPIPDGTHAWSLSPTALALIESGAFPNHKAWDAFDDLSRVHTVLANGGPIADRDGRSKLTSGGVVETDVKRTRGFMDMLYRRSAVAARVTARLVIPWAPSGHVLDLGGGHGRYGHELARLGLKVTLFDRPLCCQIAQERYGDEIGTQSGDFMVDDLGGPYDVVLLSNIVHGLGPDELDSLFGRLRAVIRPGGVVAIKDMFLDDAQARPEAAALFGVTMLLYTSAGRSYTTTEMREHLARAGFVDADTIDLSDQQFSVLIAR